MARSWKSRRFLSVILAVALFFCVTAPVSATEPEKAEETGTADFVAAAEGEIGGYALSPDFSALVFSSILPRAEADASCTWNERTQVASCIPTYDLASGTALQKAQLAEARLQMAESAMRTAELGENPAALRAARSAGQTRQVVYEAVDVKNLWYPDFVPFTMNQFSYYDKHCTPVAGLNMLKYWQTKRGVNGLYSSYYAQSFAQLRTEMGTTDTGGTNFRKGFDGMGSYIRKYASTKSLGDDYEVSTDWNWLTHNLSCNFPLVFNSLLAHYNGSPDGHSFLALGYQRCSDGNYVRVCTGWDTGLSHFYYWPWAYTDFNSMWYYRWE